VLRHLSRAICSPAPSPNRLANNGLSVKSHNNGQQLGLGVLFHLAVFLPFFIFKFPTAFARIPPKMKFLILWAAANGVHRKFNSGIFSGISLAHMSTALKN